MANCAQLLKEVERYRQNWLIKHKVSCKGGSHSPQCSKAYSAYTAKLAEWAKHCKKRFSEVTVDTLSFEVYRAFEEDLSVDREE